MGRGTQGEVAGDARVAWLLQQIRIAYKHVSTEMWDKFRNEQAANDLLEAFANADENAPAGLYVAEKVGRVVLSGIPPEKQKKDDAGFLYLLKLNADRPLDAGKCAQQLVIGECSAGVLEHAEQVAMTVFAPLLAATKGDASEMVARDIDEGLSAFVANVQIMQGHARGTTALPLPPDWAVKKPGDMRATPAHPEGPSEAKDAIHALESAIITWTKQIKAVLKEDPEGLATLTTPHPGPVAELDFWAAKSKNLDSIFDQLQSVRVRKVLRCLDKAQSTYNAPFAKLCKELFHARAEANDNCKFLGPLRKWATDLEECSEYGTLPELYPPLIHTILLIWKGSGHYNTPTRLVVLVREVCNSLVAQSQAYLGSMSIFELIDGEDPNDAREAVEALKETLRVLAAFKETYLKYKDKAATECPLNAWRVQNNAVFVRLDAFWERCHDVLELTETTMQFANLAKIEVGGTKGKVLTTSVQQIHSDFTAAVSHVRSHGDARLLDTDAKEFDDAFYEFRTAVRELEKRLASVLSQGFSDAPTLRGQFKLLDSFAGLTARQVVQEELEKKYIQMVCSFGEDVRVMQKLFVEGKDEPSIAHNLPPIAGALTWCRGLLERIKTPMAKIRKLDRAVMESEEARDVVKDYTAFQGQLSDYERDQIEAWGESVESSSQAKLKNPLLRSETEGAHPLLYVNFDPLLVRLLREVKYFLLLGFEAPQAALEIYEHAETFRKHMGNLDLVVNVYNWMQQEMLPVERPLLTRQLELLDDVLAQGIAPHKELTEGVLEDEPVKKKKKKSKKKPLNWKSNNIDLFVNETMTTANEIKAVVVCMKENLQKVEAVLDTWSVHPLLKRSGKPQPVPDFEQLQKVTLEERYKHITKGGNEIHTLMNDTNAKLKVSKGLPDWKAYLDFVNDIIVHGLKRVVVKSCAALEQQLDPIHLAKPTALGPMLEIELDLVDGLVKYKPELQQVGEQRGLRNTFREWCMNFDDIATKVRRLDTGDGSYIRELMEDMEVMGFIATIESRLNLTEQRCTKLKRNYEIYDYLWTTDLNSMFAEFLETATIKTEDASVGEEEELIETPDRLDLELFEEKIQLYQGVSGEVDDLKPTLDVDFLRIQAQPVKQALSTWCNKWMYCFTNYLQEKLMTDLRELFAFMNSIDEGLDQEVAEGDKPVLMSVMSHIRDVRQRMPTMEASFVPLRDTIELLKSNNIELDLGLVGEEEALDFLERAPLAWDNTVNKTFRVKESIQPLQNSMVDFIKRDIADYINRVKEAHRAFREDGNGPFTWLSDRIKDAYISMDKTFAVLEKLEKEAIAFKDLQELFELNRIKAPQLNDLRSELILLKQVWDAVGVVESLFGSWSDTLWLDIRPDDLVDECKKLTTHVKRLPRRLRDWPCYLRLQGSVTNMASILPLVSELRNPFMRDRHWKAVASECCRPVDKGAGFCLKDLLALQLHKHVEGIMEIVEVAQKEHKVEQKLKQIATFWSTAVLEMARHKDTEVQVIIAPDDLIETLDEHNIQLQSMAAMGRAVEFFKNEIQQWQKVLGRIEGVMGILLTVQRAWAALEAIFLGSQDIRAQLPDDTKRFENIDADFKGTMEDIFSVKKVVTVCQVDAREKALEVMYKELEVCQKALTEYLDMKKNVFPRFYFVSNMALLDILSNSNNPVKIMPHIGAVFDGIDHLVFATPKLLEGGEDEDAKKEPPREASAMVSKDGEDVPFEDHFMMLGAVEVWLNELVTFMRDTLRLCLDNSLQEASLWDTERPREEWVAFHAAQIALITSQIVWTEETETALDDLENGTDDAMKKYLEVCKGRLAQLIKQVQGPLDKGLRNKIITLITIDVHSRDIVQALITKRVENTQDFLWSSQLKFYWAGDTRDADIRICDYRSVYSFEYVGNCGRLVITPLTDRCYVTLTTAIRLFLGGAPAGPAGTGKTETTKDLSRGLGLACYVFNCSDQMNYQTMADIFRGLSQAGAWGCFDEFNRIPIEVLSVVATQVKTILDATMRFADPENRVGDFKTLPAGTPPCKVGDYDFFGQEIGLVPTCGFYITMNPGYAGRTELPENLKALFRSCAMIRPDLKPICENMLMAEGFIKALPLAVKFVTLYQLSSELLSKQAHYDWGLRAVKSVLRVAGKLKRAEPKVNEEAILMRALRDFNTPKIPAVDIPIFLRLISDLFPGLDLATNVDEVLKETALKVLKRDGLQGEDIFVGKVVQFQELLDVRHSVMLLGPPGAGKSEIWKTLVACKNLDQPKPVCVYEAVNPKAVTSDELYGYMTLSKDWKDGCLSIVMRNMCKCWQPYTPLQTDQWVVLDGDIDAVWIESMNTVMDDNKVLTLVSNERIPLTPAMRMVFEIESLRNATPATVSRAGILFINETDVGWAPFAESWVSRRESETEKSCLMGFFDKYVPQLISALKEKSVEYLTPVMTISKVAALCHLLEGYLSQVSDPDSHRIERLFLYASIWAFGGVAAADKTVDSRQVFNELWRDIAKGGLKLPEAGLCFEYACDPVTGDVCEWPELVPKYEPVGIVEFSNIVVATADLVALKTLTTNLQTNGHGVMFVGSAGTGKTVLVRDFLRSLPIEEYNTATLNFNFYTDAVTTQQQLEQPIEKRSGKSYGPPAGKTLVYFIDDLNMPFVEEYGTQTPVELLRMHADYGSWYDRVDLSLRKQIVDCQFIAAQNHKAGSFSVLGRYQRHFCALGCQSSSDADLSSIFASILDSHLESFASSVQKAGKSVVEGTLAIHREMAQRFLPSAVKFHYNFNMRDLASVFQGLCQLPPQVRQGLQVARLWMHECERVYADRLISNGEIQRCQEIIVDVAKRVLDEDPDALFKQPNAWTTFATQTLDESKAYLPVKSMASLSKVLHEQLKEYNEQNAIMNLVLFDQAMLHVVRIARIIGFPQGNALLVGVGGSGKQSLARLASFICGNTVSQIAVTSTFGVSELKEELKELYRKAGVKPAEPITFLLTDSQIVDERFLVFFNDVLASGIIPDLFTRDEYDAIFGALRNAAKAEGVADTSDSMMEYFIGRVRHNLHVVLCFSPIGELFRVRARKFPALINCTAIDWFHPWPKDALVSVAQHFLGEVDLGPADVADNICFHVAEVHASVGDQSVQYYAVEKRYNYVTPTSFLELISFYKSLLAERRNEMKAQIERLATGLQTLKNTNKDVTALKEDLKIKMVEVDKKKVACDAFLEKMGEQRAIAEGEQDAAKVVQGRADAAASDAAKIEESAAGDLAKVQPILDAAKDAVNCLDKASITELKSFSKPPTGVDKVTDVLLILVKGAGKKALGWDAAKKMMAKVDAFLQSLVAYKGEDIPEDIVKRCQPFLDDPGFTYEKMKSKSAAAANLCNWAINIIMYNKVYKKIRPLMEDLAAAQAVKAKAMEELAVVDAKLAKINEALDKLQMQFLEATSEKAQVEAIANACQDRLSLAERLTSGLASEYDRWTIEVERLRSVEKTLVGDVLLGAAFVSYIGAFGSQFRKRLTNDFWIADLVNRQIPMTAGIEPLDLLTNDSQKAQWQNEGLPADRISIENGAIITNCNRWPLIIDPQLQGISWIRSHEEAKLKIAQAAHAEKEAARAARKGDDEEEEPATQAGIVQLQLGEKNWVFRVTEAIRNGDCVIVENLGEQIDAVLDPVLARTVVRKGRQLFLKFGGEEVEYDPGFKLYLQTRLANPHYKPEIAAQCTLINFIVTQSGLEDQLLAKVVGRERADIEAQKNELVQKFNEYKIQLKELEDDLLYKLANAPVDILSDIPLIEGLESTKATAGEIALAVKKGKETEIGINEAREVYRPVAAEASCLYFMLLQLNKIQYAYQYSLASFETFFKNGMSRAVMADEAKKRVDALLSSVRWTIFQWVARGLFERHRLVFLVQVVVGLLQQGLNDTPEDGGEGGAWSKISELSGYSPEALAFLLRGPQKDDPGDAPAPWLQSTAWAMVGALAEQETLGFEKLPADLEESAPRFLEWFNHPTPETEKLPLDWRDLDRRPFKKLLVVRCLRPDRLTSALMHFVRTTLPGGSGYADLDADSNSMGVLEQAFDDASPTVPIYFILSPGANVVADVDKLAERDGMRANETYFNVSLGQGQDIVAQERLEAAHRSGHWVILNNVHLMPKWLKKVEKLLDEYAESGSHANFRVFMSSDPSNSIPIGILDRSIKLTCDPPSGLQANVKQAFCTFSREEYEELEGRTRGILFGLCYFHAIMLERRKFGAQGRNMHYPFAIGDLINSASVLRNYMENAPTKVPWDDLRYLFGEIMYGGHIVNDFDRLVSGEYLAYFMKDELLDEMDMYPYPDVKLQYFAAPQTSDSYDKILQHMDTMQNDSPLAYGFHPNAEIGFRTDQSEQLCVSILDLGAGSAEGAEEGDSKQTVAEGQLQDILENHRDAQFDIDAVLSLLDEPGPYHTVFLQECELMNGLIQVMLATLEELDLGFKGELTMGDHMEKLQDALYLDRVPQVWLKVAYPSIRGLTTWLSNLKGRLEQLREWTNGPTDIPPVTWLSGLFNPTSFLTAVMQTTAQAQSLELDKLRVATEVTKRMDPSEFSTHSRDGAYVYGLSLEGARWSMQGAVLEASAAGEMTCAMPVINCKAAPADKAESNVYECPCYMILRRGPTYVFSAPLKTKAPSAKWVLAGTALIMDVATK